MRVPRIVRRSAIACLCVLAACPAGDDDMGLPVAGPYDPTRADGSDTSPAEDGSDTDAEGSSSTASSSASTGAGDTSTGTGGVSAGTFTPLDDGGTDDAGGQPSDGWWSHCLGASDCEPGLACLGTDDMTDGVCTAECAPFGNPRSCASSPGGTALPACLTVRGHSICALDCSGGRSCPGGMACLADTDDHGAIAICL